MQHFPQQSWILLVKWQICFNLSQCFGSSVNLFEIHCKTEPDLKSSRFHIFQWFLFFYVTRKKCFLEFPSIAQCIHTMFMIWNACLRHGSWTMLFYVYVEPCDVWNKLHYLKILVAIFISKYCENFHLCPFFQNYWCRTEICKLLWKSWDASSWCSTGDRAYSLPTIEQMFPSHYCFLQ